jgi:NADH-quinone oxidoreductase subunit M
MINHGLSTGALFLLVGMIYERLHTRQLEEMGGLASRMPIFACFLVFISLSSMGLPGLNGFIGEVLSLIGMFKYQPIYAVLGTVGIVLGAWYLLNMLQLSLFGPRREAHDRHALLDLGAREIFALAPIAVICLVIGVFPRYFLNVMEPEVNAIASLYPPQQNETVVASAALAQTRETP